MCVCACVCVCVRVFVCLGYQILPFSNTNSGPSIGETREKSLYPLRVPTDSDL